MPKGLHQRLTEIVHEVTCENDVANELEGEFYFDRKHRTRVREIGRNLIRLMDEYDALDPLV